MVGFLFSLKSWELNFSSSFRKLKKQKQQQQQKKTGNQDSFHFCALKIHLGRFSYFPHSPIIATCPSIFLLSRPHSDTKKPEMPSGWKELLSPLNPCSSEGTVISLRVTFFHDNKSHCLVCKHMCFILNQACYLCCRMSFF